SKVALCLVSRETLSKKIEEIAKSAGSSNSSLRACIVWGYGAKEVMESSLFEDYIDIAFEDRSYMAIKDHKVYLSHLFGDFMQLPPIDKQVSHHEYTAYWK
ncbi:MAG: LicD family protein, partial [Bacteroidales bacterium]|nr:LicD family protein [Candidatus Scybalocola fimicaballi]